MLLIGSIFIGLMVFTGAACGWIEERRRQVETGMVVADYATATMASIGVALCGAIFAAAVMLCYFIVKA